MVDLSPIKYRCPFSQFAVKIVVSDVISHQRNYYYLNDYWAYIYQMIADAASSKCWIVEMTPC